MDEIWLIQNGLDMGADGRRALRGAIGVYDATVWEAFCVQSRRNQIYSGKSVFRFTQPTDKPELWHWEKRWRADLHDGTRAEGLEREREREGKCLLTFCFQRRMTANFVGNIDVLHSRLCLAQNNNTHIYNIYTKSGRRAVSWPAIYYLYAEYWKTVCYV